MQARSGLLVRHLQRFIDERGFALVLSFAAHKGEPDLAGLRAATLGLPVVSAAKGQMLFYAWTAGETLVRNRYGIAEPQASGAPLTVVPGATLVLVPAVALDVAGVRLGYGGGYYDRFFAAGMGDGALLVGVALAEFVVKTLPRETHDRRVDYLATEDGVVAASDINA